METRPVGDSDLQDKSPPPTAFQFPLLEERRVLERLAVLDLAGAQPPLKAISKRLRGVRRGDLPAASLYAFDLVSAVNRLVWRGGSEERRRGTNRQFLIEAFSPISEAWELPDVFEKTLSFILAPFREVGPEQHPTILRAKTFIQESYHRKISLKEVAAHLGLSRTYLSTLFRRECGTTLTGYLHRIRLRRAQELIRGGQTALSEVAARVGYQNYRNFHRNFVRYHHASPNRFKREIPPTGSPEELVSPRSRNRVLPPHGA